MQTTAWNFQFWNVFEQKYDSAFGTYVFMIGSSSADIRLQLSCEITDFLPLCKDIPTSLLSS
jgi:hypothetical protein